MRFWGWALVVLASVASSLVVVAWFGDDVRRLTRPAMREYSDVLLGAGANDTHRIALKSTGRRDETVGTSMNIVALGVGGYLGSGGWNFQEVNTLPADTSIRRLSRSVGRLVLTDPPPNVPQICTGTLLSNGFILTAAHCFFRDAHWTWEEPSKVSKVEFQLGHLYYSENPDDDPDILRLKVELKPVEMACPAVPCTLIGDSSDGYDFALLRLERDEFDKALAAGYGAARLADIALVPDHQLLTFQHNSSDKVPLLFTERHCLGTTDRPSPDEAVFSHYCDTLPGSSGAPVLSRDHEAVLGMHFEGQRLLKTAEREARVTPNRAIRLTAIAAISHRIGEDIPIERSPPTAEQRFLIDYANLRGEEATALLSKNRATIAAYVALSGLEEILVRPEPERAYLFSRVGSTQARLAAALYQNREMALLEREKALGAMFSPDGRWVISWGYGHKAPGEPTFGPAYGTPAKLWSAVTGELLDVPKLSAETFGQAHFSSDSKRVVTWSLFPSHPKVWSIPSGELIKTLPFLKSGGVRIDPAATRALIWERPTGNVANAPELVSLRSEDFKLTLKEQTNITGAQFSPDGTRLVTWSASPNVLPPWRGAPGSPKRPPDVSYLWDTKSGAPLKQLNDSGMDPIHEVRFNPALPSFLTWTQKQATLHRLSDGRAFKTLTPAHSGPIQEAQYSSKGHRLVTQAFGVRRLKIWDGQSGSHLRDIDDASVDAGSVLVRGFRLSPDGSRLLTWAPNGPIHLWKVDDPAPPILLQERLEGSAQGANFARDSIHVVAWRFDRREMETSVFDVNRCGAGSLCTPQSRYRSGGHSAPSTLDVAAQFNSSMNRILVRDASDARLWTIQPTTWSQSLDQTEVEVRPAGPAGSRKPQSPPSFRETLMGDLSHRTRRAATVANDGHDIALWDLDSGQFIKWLAVGNDRVAELKFSPDGEWLVACSRDGVAMAFEARTGRSRNRLSGLSYHNSITFSPDNTNVVFWGAFEEFVRLWRFRSGPAALRLSWQPERETRDSAGIIPVTRIVSFNRDGTLFVTLDGGSAVRVWDSAKGAMKHELRAPDGRRLIFASLSPGGNLIAAAETRTRMPLPPAPRNEVEKKDSARPPWRTDSAVEGQTAPAWDTGKAVVHIWRMSSGEKVQSLDWPGVPNRTASHLVQDTLDFSSDETKLLTLLKGDAVARVWNIAARSPVPRELPPSRPGSAKGARFNSTASVDSSAAGAPRTTHALTWSINSPDVLLWNVSDFSSIELTGHRYWLRDAAFSADGQKLITWSEGDKVARLWNVAEGALVRSLNGYEDAILGARFSPDGKTLATWEANYDHIRLWDARSGTLTADLESSVMRPIFDAHGSRLAVWPLQGTALKTWRVLGSGECLIASAYERLKHVIPSPTECERYGVSCDKIRKAESTGCANPHW